MTEPLFPDGHAGATMSDDGLFRYSLWRRWARGRQMTFVMLNPSTAGAAKDDPTLRRCIRFAKSQGCGRVTVVNLFPYRTHKPKYLLEARDAGIDVTGGPDGGAPILSAIDGVTSHGDILVAAWGAHPIAKSSTRAVLIAEVAERIPVRCYGMTKDGSPKHPLYLPADSPLIAWPS